MKQSKISFIQKIKKQISSEKGEIGDSFMTVIALLIAAVLMFGIPLLTVANRADDINQQMLQTETSEWVNEIAGKAKLTMDDYSAFVERISASTGVACEVEMVVRIQDENAGKKTSQTSNSKNGENETIDEHTSQIMDKLEKYGVYLMKEGDYFYVTVKSTALGSVQKLANMFYEITGQDITAYAASARSKCYHKWKIKKGVILKYSL